MPSNFLNDVRHKDNKRETLQADYDAFVAAGRTVTVGTPCIPVPRQPAKVAPKKLTLKQVSKKWRESFYGKD